MDSEPFRTVFLGATRGLGAATLRKMLPLKTDTLVVGRNLSTLEDIHDKQLQKYAFDLSIAANIQKICEVLLEFKPERVFYFAGGGPWGEFQNQKWESHLWAWQVTFLSQAQILHKIAPKNSLKQWIGIGSAIAELEADMNAASYCAAKHALRGWHSTVRKEHSQKNSADFIDLRLYSPGYMNTGMIPGPVAKQLEAAGQLLDVDVVAEDLIKWCDKKLESGDSGHRIFNPIRG